MRRLQSVLGAAVAAISLAGCIKTGSPGSNLGGGGTGSGSFYIKSYQYLQTDTVLANTSDQYTFNLTLDNSNRITQGSQTGTNIYKGTSTSLTDNTTWTYGQGTQTGTSTLQFGNLTSSATLVYYLNASGFPDSLVSKSTSGAATIYTKGIYSYDGNGYCTETDAYTQIAGSYTATTQTFFTISGGNVVGEDVYLAGGGQLSSTVFNYGSTPNNTILRFSTPPIAGKTNQNLVESMQTTKNGVPICNLSFSYTFDSKNRVASCTQTTPSGKVFAKFYNIQYIN